MSLPFEALARAITYQQMSDAAAAKTYKHLQRSLETALTPERVVALPHDMMRAVGLSKSKAHGMSRIWPNGSMPIPIRQKICRLCQMMKSSKPSPTSRA